MADRVPVHSGELEYEVQGTGEPVLLIHGAILADAFRPLLTQSALADHYRLMSYHRRGFAGAAGIRGRARSPNKPPTRVPCWITSASSAPMSLGTPRAA